MFEVKQIQCHELGVIKLSIMDIRNANGETDDILGYLVYVVEYISHCIFSNSRHCVCLAAACLPVGKNSCWKIRVSGEKFYQLVW